MTDRLSRIAPLAGVVFVALAVASFIVGGETPDFDAGTQEVLDFYAAHESAQFAAAILFGYAAFFFVVFGAALNGALRRDDTSHRVAATSGFAGSVLAALGVLAFASFTFVLADAHDSLEPAAAQALNALNGDFFFPIAVGTALYSIGFGLAIERGVVLPAWLGWLGVVIGIAAVTPIGFFAFLASGIWTLILSIGLYRSTPAGAAPAA